MICNKLNKVVTISFMLLFALLLFQSPVFADEQISITIDDSSISIENGMVTVKSESPYANIAVSHVSENSYVNVRSEPNTTSEVLGKLYNDCAATILETTDQEDGEWYKIESGSVEGYVKAEYFLTGDAAEERAMEIGKLEGKVNTNGSRLRSDPNLTTSRILTNLYTGEKYNIIGIEGAFYKVVIDEDLEGYVYQELMDAELKFDTAISLEEEAEQQRQRSRAAGEAVEAAERLAEARTAAATVEIEDASRDALVAYAKQWVGVTPHVYGGTSLTNGADCSGFVQVCYQNALGISLSRTSRSQASGGREVSLEEVQPGDLVFYNGGGKGIDHVAMYIGGGQVVHASSSRVGTIISNMYYRTPCKAVNYID